jgi:type I restriction enzyme, R subunit
MHAPFFGTLKEAIERERNAALTPDDPSFREVADLTVNLVDGIRTKIQVVDFWRDEQSRLSLEKSVYQVLLRSGKVARARIAELATRIVELARHRHRWLIWGNGKNQDK